MIVGVLALMLVSADTTMRIAPPVDESMTVVVAAASDTLSVPMAAVNVPTAALPPHIETVDDALRLRYQVQDTVIKKKKRVLVEYSDWYGRRLAVHRVLSWAMIPLFAVSYWTGEKLATNGRVNSPYYIRALHPYAATGASVVFGVNTLTGLWNLWDARHDPAGRKKRIIHSVLFMIADGGFAYAGSIGKQARDDGAIRDKHRTIALSSMGVSYVSMMIMLLGGK